MEDVVVRAELRGKDGEKVNLSLYADGAIVMSDGNGAYISLDLQQQRLLRRMLEG